MFVRWITHTMCMSRVAHTMHVAGIAQKVGMRVRRDLADYERDILRAAVAPNSVPLMPEPAEVMRPSTPAPFIFSRQAKSRPPRLGKLNVVDPSPGP